MAAQEPREPAWAAFAFICGLLAYIALPVEPPLVLVLLVGLAVCVTWRLARLGRANPLARLIVVALAGLAWGQLYVALNPVTTLPASTGKVQVSGWVQEVDRMSAARVRLIIEEDKVSALRPQYVPHRLQLSALARDLPLLTHGQYVRFQAWLYPPLTPVQPGGWDHARSNWFMGLGGSGRIAGPVAIDDALSRPAGWRGWVDSLRASIGQRIRANLPEREAGFAIALITGERSGLDRETREALQITGLAHILAISGLHMSLVAGGVFWLLRALMALWPGLALNWPIRKLAAMAGLAAAGFYLRISGQAIATQRAFIMLAVMFVAVLLGRSALSMRNLAVAAFIVLLISPQAVLTPSFQMSFPADTGLIAGFEAVSGWQSRLHEKLASYQPA